MDFEIFNAGDVQLQSGEILHGCQIAYKTYGVLNAERTNGIVMCTPFGGRHLDIEWMVGADRALDPSRYFIIIPNMIGNGLSSSPSHDFWMERRQFPLVTLYDNVRLQQRLISELFAIETIKLVLGWSMGGQQAYHWAALFPDRVEKFACLCGSAKTARHNFVFLESIKAALQADPNCRDGWFVAPADRGLRAAALAFASWALSQSFYREENDRKLGFEALGDFLQKNWIQPFALRDANNLCAMIATWQNADISDNPVYHGRFDQALRSIRAGALIMPSETDLYFPVEDNRREVEAMSRAKLLPIPSIWGHRAGNNPAGQSDVEFVSRAIRGFLR
jgi:homoserine O-acetyltransferase